MSRTVALAALVLVTLAALAGCLSPVYTPVPGDSNQLGIRKTDAGPEFVFEPCPGKRLIALTLLSPDPPSASWRVELPDNAVGGDLRSVQTFVAPAGWSTVDNSLSAITPGKSYVASAVSGLTGESSRLPNITLEQIDALDTDEILARVSVTESGPMSAADFRKNATEHCS